MKKYILGAVLSLGILASPAFAGAAGLTNTQVQAILAILSSFGADSATIANVQTALTGGTPTTTGTSFCHTFYNDLTIGTTDKGASDITALNKALELSGIETGGNTGTFDENTAGDVVSFQAKYGIRPTGYVGPRTREKLNALYGCSNVPVPVESLPTPTNITAPTISSIQSKAADTGQVYVGEQAYIVGTGLSGTVTVKIGGQVVTTASDKDTVTTFLVPSLPAGYTDVSVRNTAGQVSNTYKVLVVVPTTVSTGTTGTLSFSRSSFSATYVQGKSLPSTLSSSPDLYTNTGYYQSGTFTNTSNVNVSYTISVPNQPTWLNSGYSTVQATVVPGQVTGIGAYLNPATVATTPGTYTTNIIITGNFINSPMIIPVTLTVVAPTSSTDPLPTITNLTVSPNPTPSGTNASVDLQTNTAASCSLFLDGAALISVATAPNAHLTASIGTSLSPGTHTVVATCKNSSGSTTNTYPFTVNVAAPTASLTVNGLHNLALANNSTVSALWSSTNGTKWTASFDATGSVCASPQKGTLWTWITSPTSPSTGAKGSFSNQNIGTTFAGCTVVITYTVSGAEGSASDSVTFTVPTLGTWTYAPGTGSCTDTNASSGTNLGGGVGCNTIGATSPYTTCGSNVAANTFAYGCAKQYYCSPGVYTCTASGAVSINSSANQTASALNAYSSAMGGVTGSPAMNPAGSSFSYVWNNNLQIGSQNVADVTALQTALAREGVYQGDISGGFYNQTFTAVKAFQQKYGIEATGFVGPDTRTKLNALY